MMYASDIIEYLDFFIYKEEVVKKHFDQQVASVSGKNFTYHICNETDIEAQWDFPSEKIEVE